MLSIRRFFLCSAAFVSLAFISPSHATDLLSNVGAGTINTSTHDNTLGYDFTVGTNPLLVTALGVYRGPGFNGTLVGLWDTSGVLLASASVPNIGSDTFVFSNLLAPVLLLPGQTYVVGARYQVGVSLFINGPGETFYDSANVTVNHDRYILNSGFAFPTGTETSVESYVGPNLRYTVQAVPEPASIFLMGTASIALMVGRRLRGAR